MSTIPCVADIERGGGGTFHTFPPLPLPSPFLSCHADYICLTEFEVTTQCHELGVLTVRE